MWRHSSFWRSLDPRHLEKQDLDYFHRQYRRRVQTSAMIGVAGIMIMWAEWLTRPLVALFYLVGLILLVCWILLMGVQDLLSTQTHLREARKRRLSKQSEMQAEVARLRKLYRKDDNGEKPKG